MTFGGWVTYPKADPNVSFSPFDTVHCEEDGHHLRLIIYANTDIFLVGFAIHFLAFLDNASFKVCSKSLLEL